MTASIAELARALSPLELVSYLRSRGWHEERTLGTRGGVWLLSCPGGEEAEVLLPYDLQLADYSTRMREALKALEAVESRPVADIARDVATSGADLLRFRVTGNNSHEGSLPLEAAPVLAQGVHDLLLAAACATVEPRPVYPTRKPAAALRFMQQARFGQTERGSFTLTVLSPVSPQLSLGDTQEAEMEAPFERRVVTTLMEATRVAATAATKATSTGDLRAFQQAVPQGLSANLCEALASLTPFCDPAEGLSVSVSWASSRPGPRNVPTRLSVAPATGAVLAEAARLFRSTTPQPDVEVRGVVVKLERAEAQAEGMVTLLALVEGQPRRVEVRLEAEDYAKAARAHMERLAVGCQGELRRRGNLFRLENARQFSTEE